VDGQRYSTANFYGWEVDAPVDAGLLLSSRNFGRLHGLSGITAIVFYTQQNLTRQMSFRLLGSEMSTYSDPLAFPAKHALYSGPDCIVHSNLLESSMAYRAAWLVRILAARARSERAHNVDTYQQERAGMAHWLDSTIAKRRDCTLLGVYLRYCSLPRRR
jgi:hypothetical protein